MNLLKRLKKFAFRDYLTDHPRVYRRFGSTWLLKYRNYIDRKLILGERYVVRQIEYCMKVIRENGINCFIDAGANFGLYSISLANNFPTLEAVFAFEPDLRNFNHLSANIYLNSLDSRIDARSIGLSNEKTQLLFFSNRGNSTGQSRIAETAPAGTDVDRFDKTAIEVDTLDSQLSLITNKVVYMKIDVEGHEKSVISGARKFLQRNSCYLQVEILNDPEIMLNWMHAELKLSCFHRVDNDFFFRNFA